MPTPLDLALVFVSGDIGNRRPSIIGTSRKFRQRNTRNDVRLRDLNSYADEKPCQSGHGNFRFQQTQLPTHLKLHMT